MMMVGTQWVKSQGMYS